jgi:putative Mg2+ transporter-C (MgtC) family protein
VEFGTPGLTDALKLIAATGLGLLIGFEREMEHRPAGVKTFGIVTMTSTLLMILALQLAAGSGVQTVDAPARVAAAVMTGIGFLGAGVIMQTGAQIQGITTAALIWLMAGVGLCIGCGMYWIAGLAVALAWLGLRLDPLVQRLIARREARRSRQ